MESSDNFECISQAQAKNMQTRFGLIYTKVHPSYYFLSCNSPHIPIFRIGQQIPHGNSLGAAGPLSPSTPDVWNVGDKHTHTHNTHQLFRSPGNKEPRAAGGHQLHVTAILGGEPLLGQLGGN